MTFADDEYRRRCIDDELGDKLDSVLSAVQAAWSVMTERRVFSESPQRANQYGVPVFAVAALRHVVELEGWIADPLLLECMPED